MRITVLTMLAALLLSLCIACNDNKAKTPVSLSTNRSKIKDVSLVKEESPAKDANTTFSSGLISTDSSGIATDKEYEQTQVPPSAPKTPKPGGVPAANPDWDKKIIKTADLNVEVKNFLSFGDRLRQAVKRSGGYIAQEGQTQSAYNIENTVTIKIPVDQFDELLPAVLSDSDKLMEKRISSEDVTGQMVDTRARLETKKEVRQRYLELLKQAKNMKDILAVQEELNGLQEEMDAAAGRVAYLGHSAAFSTINLKFYQVLDPTAKGEPSSSFWRRIREAMGEGWNGMSSVVLGLISIWPLLLLGGTVWIVARKRIRIVRFTGSK